MRKCPEETRPACAAIELGRRIEQREGARRAHKRALAMFVVERTGEGVFGARLAQDMVALRPEDLLPLCRRMIHCEGLRRAGASGPPEQQQRSAGRPCKP